MYAIIYLPTGEYLYPFIDPSKWFFDSYEEAEYALKVRANYYTLYNNEFSDTDLDKTPYLNSCKGTHPVPEYLLEIVEI